MRTLSLVSFALAAVALASCTGNNKAEDTDQRPLVKIASSTMSDVEQTVDFTGTIEPYVQNVICPSTPVRIDQILVEVGDHVQKGQLVVKMDQTQYRTASVQLANLEADYKRLQAVYDAQGISKQQVDAQLTQVEVSRETVKNLMDNIELRSPITGIVTGRYYDPGDMFSLTPVNGVTGILTIMQMDRLKVKINVSEQYFPDVKMGMPVDIRLDIFPDQKFAGKVSLIYPAIDPSTRTFTVEITIPNGNMKLRPGMFCRVALNFGSAERVMIPDISLQKQAGTNEKYIYVIRDSVAHRQTVTIGRQIGDRYETLSGVAAGEDIVIAGASRLSDGVAVKITNN